MRTRLSLQTLRSESLLRLHAATAEWASACKVLATNLPRTCAHTVGCRGKACGAPGWSERLGQAPGLCNLAVCLAPVCHWCAFASRKIVIASLRSSLAGAAVIKQMDFKLAMAHERLVCEVAFAAGRSTMMGVIFDEVVRWIAVLRCARKRLSHVSLAGSTVSLRVANWVTASSWKRCVLAGSGSMPLRIRGCLPGHWSQRRSLQHIGGQS